MDVGDGTALFEGGMAGLVSDSDIVDEVAVVGVVGLEGAESGFGGVEVVFEASIVDDPEVGDDVSDDAAAAIAVDDVVEDEGGRSIGGGGVVRAAGEVEDDAVAVGVMGALVDFTGDDVVGDEVVEAGVVIEPLVGVVGDGAGPAIPLGVGGTGGDIAVVVDEVVVGGEVIAVDGSDAGTAGVGDGVGDETKVMGAAAKEAVGGVGIAIEVEAAEFEISGAGREGTAADIEHSGSVGATGPEEVDGGGVVVFIGDPGRGRAASGRGEGGGKGISTAEEANDGTGGGSGSGAGEGFRGRRGGTGVGAGAGGGSEEGAIGSGGGIVDGEVDEGTGGGVTGGVVDFSGKSVGAIGEGIGIEGEGPAGGAGGVAESAAIDGDLHGGDGQTVGS